MKLILLDTNFFLVPFQLGINIFSELEHLVPGESRIVTIAPVKAELENLAKTGKGDERSTAAIAINLARNITVLDADGKADDAILNFAKIHKDIIVATNDSKLRKKLKAQKTRTIYVRNRSKLEIA